MAFTNSDYDDLRNTLYGLPCGLFMYVLNSYTLSSVDDNQIIGTNNVVQSVQLAPFLNTNDLDGYIINYDSKKYGAQLSSSPKVYRINNVINPLRVLGNFKCYKPSKNIGGSVSWTNESRLYNYPYMFAYLTDNLNSPMEIKYHLCPSNDVEVKCINTISDRCSYGIFIEGYKGDNYGTMEAMVSGDAHELPCSSSAYSQWLANNKNQITQNIKNMQTSTLLQNQGISTNVGYNNKALDQQAWSTGVSSAVGTIESIIGLFSGAGSGLASSVNGLMNTAYSMSGLQKDQNRFNSLNQQAINNQNVHGAIQSAMAQANDMKSVPNTMVSMGSDFYYGYVKGEQAMHLYRMGLHNEVYKKLGDYFCKYGYKQNKILPIETRSRYYFNYIKTIGCNMVGDVPRIHLEKLKSIFDNGVTLWHVDRDGVEPLNHFKADNYEYKESSPVINNYDCPYFEINGESLVNVINQDEALHVSLEYATEGNQLFYFRGDVKGKARPIIHGNTIEEASCFEENLVTEGMVTSGVELPQNLGKYKVTITSKPGLFSKGGN